MKFLESITGKNKNVKRNNRDNVYNICSNKEDAQRVIEKIYYKGCICLDRKKEKAKEVLLWNRPKNMRKEYISKKWTEKEDKIVISHSVSQSMDILKRTKSSVVMRQWRLKNNLICKNSC